LPGPAKYDRLARRYDRRWAFYLRESIRHTLAQVALQPHQRLLDVGCGTGRLLADVHASLPSASLVGVDLSTRMLGMARARLPRGIDLIQGAAEHLPIAGSSVDWLVTSSAFHYVTDPFAARREYRRVLRPGGTLVLTDWCADYPTMRLQARWSRATDPAFRRIYTALELQAILVAGGFDVAVDIYKISWYWGLLTVRATKA
jgi:ubiquinone/menaquinone biosynthesis C-methylase UbiE